MFRDFAELSVPLVIVDLLLTLFDLEVVDVYASLSVVVNVRDKPLTAPLKLNELLLS